MRPLTDTHRISGQASPNRQRLKPSRRQSTVPAMTETRPTAGERVFFDSKGYLQLDSLLPSTLVERLLDRLDAA